MNGPIWSATLGKYLDQYRDKPYEGTDRMPDNGPDGDVLTDEQETNAWDIQDAMQRDWDK